MKIYTPYQQKVLSENPNVAKVTDEKLFFKPKFKIKAIKARMKGIVATEIFIEAGFDPSFFSYNYFKDTLKKWVKKYRSDGEESFYIELPNLGVSKTPVHNKLDGLSIDDLKALVYMQGEIIEEIKKKKALAKK
jgi:hypothetical protein